MRPTTAINDNVFDFQALLHPGIVFEHPKDVVAHPDLTVAEKRAIWLPGPPMHRRSRLARHCALRQV